MELLVTHRKHIMSPLRAQQVNTIHCLWQWYVDITNTIVETIHHTVLYLNLHHLSGTALQDDG
jgi:hypothetical protein